MRAAVLCFESAMEPEVKALARGLRSRDPGLLDQLIERYQYRLFRYLLSLTGSRETAEDLFQETWVRVLERGHQYDGKSRFEAWLFTIARHLVIDFLRKKAPQSLDDLVDSGEAEIEARPASSPVDELSRREAGERVEAALGRLSAAYREVLVLRFQEELALEEISAVVSAPLSTVKSRLYRGLDELRGLLGGAER